jgi:hypothetical protein
MTDPREIAELIDRTRNNVVDRPVILAAIERAIRMTIEAGPGTVAEICNRLRQKLENKA